MFNIDEIVKSLEAEDEWGKRIDLFRDEFGGKEIKSHDYFARANLFWQGENGLVMYLEGDCRGLHEFPPFVIGSGESTLYRYPIFLESSLEDGAKFSSYEWDKVQEGYAKRQQSHIDMLMELMGLSDGEFMVPDVKSSSEPEDHSKDVTLYAVILNQSRDLSYGLRKNSDPKETFFCAMNVDRLK